ncbi:E3 ubiquitin-protein ligase RNF115/126 protein [Dioscorea alata]|uniref:E3 ubiquitin-protein ligase RNF115/126 protein n=1 Tax=Dioscorea alata TaxID=55571 RepID=A0ACB7WTS0_DIOAL|nr:E3 ubiquitin-protein ligase RNF115/126 protein [Dioscorea alata]
MSSTGAPPSAGAGAAAQQRYFCHQCDRTVLITPDPDTDLVCPLCHGGFIEEFDLPSNPNPNSNPNRSSTRPSPFLALSSAMSPFFSASSSSLLFPSAPTAFDVHQASDLTDFLNSDRFPPIPSLDGTEAFNPLAFLENYLNSLTAGGANIQVVLEGAPPLPAGANLGDYFIGPGLEQLIQQLAENDPNRYGTPPAAKSAVVGLPDVLISAELLASDDAQCAVCRDTFEIGAEAKQMPCRHIYHKDCILPWLELHNSCPVCRYELPTDDPDYEQRRGVQAPAALGAGGSGASGGSGGQGAASGDGNSPTQRMVERRFRISLPWPLRMLGSQAEGSNTGGGPNSDGGASGGNAGSGGSGDSRSEPRHEDMD